MPTQTAQLIDGKSLAREMRQALAARVADLRSQGRNVRLDAVMAAPPDCGATIYAANQGKACESLGIEYHLHTLADDSSFDEVAGRVLLLNEREDVTAIMVHMPLPTEIDPYQVQRLIRSEKDVEGVNPANIGNVVYGRSSLVPCTALAVVTMIESTGIQIAGKRAVVVGASDIVGKPVAVLLMRREATVISCNIHTARIEELTREADILISAVGKPGLITASMVKPGACVVDVGTTRVPCPSTGGMKTIGDVDFDAVREVAAWISPVPGGVGPVTVSMLMRNVVDAAQR